MRDKGAKGSFDRFWISQQSRYQIFQKVLYICKLERVFHSFHLQEGGTLAELYLLLHFLCMANSQAILRPDE